MIMENCSSRKVQTNANLIFIRVTTDEDLSLTPIFGTKFSYCNASGSLSVLTTELTVFQRKDNERQSTAFSPQNLVS